MSNLPINEIDEKYLRERKRLHDTPSFIFGIVMLFIMVFILLFFCGKVRASEDKTNYFKCPHCGYLWEYNVGYLAKVHNKNDAKPIYSGEKVEQGWSNDEIADAIFLAEGGHGAKYLYGIVSVKYRDEKDARRICINTIQNNRKRFADYGYKEYNTYLEFLASRYAPIGAKNDPKGLNKNWLRNVRFYLTHPSKYYIVFGGNSKKK